MILDRTWNKKDQKLTISYIDKLGNRKFYSKHLHHIKSYEYDTQGEYPTWNGRRANKVFKDTINYYECMLFEMFIFLIDFNKIG